MSDKNAILERVALGLEKIATCIREKDIELFDKLTHDVMGPHCSFSQICVDVDLSKAREIIVMWHKTRIINGFEVPAPERIEPKVGDLYFSPGTLFEEFYKKDWWARGSYESLLLKRGLVFLNEEDAIANAKAMLGIDPYKESEE